ncbi:hypothetical protein ACLB2K_061899 [Fragaria x ananassa]
MGGRGKRRVPAQRQHPAQCGQRQAPDPGLSSSDWASMPGRILDSVTDKLSSPWDYVRLSAVCKNWYTVAKHNQSKSSGLKGAPMLLIHQSGKCNDPWHLYDVFEEKVLSLKCDIPNYRYCGSCHGWLIAVEGKDLSVILVNPFMRVGKTSAK